MVSLVRVPAAASWMIMALTTKSTTRSRATKSPFLMASPTLFPSSVAKKRHSSSEQLMTLQCGKCWRHRWTLLSLLLPGPPMIHMTGVAEESNWLISKSTSWTFSLSSGGWLAYKKRYNAYFSSNFCLFLKKLICTLNALYDPVDVGRGAWYQSSACSRILSKATTKSANTSSGDRSPVTLLKGRENI